MIRAPSGNAGGGEWGSPRAASGRGDADAFGFDPPKPARGAAADDFGFDEPAPAPAGRGGAPDDDGFGFDEPAEAASALGRRAFPTGSAGSGDAADFDPFSDTAEDTPANVTEEVSTLNFDDDAPRAGPQRGEAGFASDTGDDLELFGLDEAGAGVAAPGPASSLGGLAAMDDVFAPATESAAGDQSLPAPEGASPGGAADESSLVDLDDLTGERREAQRRRAGRAPTKPTTMAQLKATRRPDEMALPIPVPAAVPVPMTLPVHAPIGMAGFGAPMAAPGIVAAPLRVPGAAPPMGMGVAAPYGIGVALPRPSTSSGAGQLPGMAAGGGLDALMRAEVRGRDRPRMKGSSKSDQQAGPADNGGIDIDPFA